MEEAAEEDHQKADKKKKAKKVKKSNHDSDEDPEVDPYYEFLSSEDEEDIAARNESTTYGMINNQYNPSNIVNPEAPLERIDKESGLPVYKAHILKVGEGGGTPLCPFDCNCCF